MEPHEAGGKASIIPPPQLDELAQAVAQAIQCWDDGIAVTHWDLFDHTRVDGADFYVGEEELGHIHLNGDVHMAATKAIYQALITAELAGSLPYGSGNKRWVRFPIQVEAHSAHATWLFRLGYHRLKGTPESELLRRIKSVRSPIQVV